VGRGKWEEGVGRGKLGERIEMTLKITKFENRKFQKVKKQ
jgi:hypothetical protein